jgi:hypothetical protein
MSIRVRNVFYPMDLCDAVGDARKYWRISEEIVAILVRALWKRWRMFRRVALGRAGLGTGGVAAVSPVVTSVAWEK